MSIWRVNIYMCGLMSKYMGIKWRGRVECIIVPKDAYGSDGNV